MNTPPLPQTLIDDFVGSAHGNFTRVRELLEANPSLLNANASWNERAIQAAAQTAQVDIAEYLLAAGAPLDICTAAMLGRKQQVLNLLQTDPSLIHAKGAHGLPLMYFPAINNQLEIAEILLAHGADPNASTPGGTTPLHGTVMFNRPQMTRWLLAHGADPNPRYNGKTPLAIALEKGLVEIVEILRQQGGLE